MSQDHEFNNYDSARYEIKEPLKKKLTSTISAHKKKDSGKLSNTSPRKDYVELNNNIKFQTKVQPIDIDKTPVFKNSDLQTELMVSSSPTPPPVI